MRHRAEISGPTKFGPRTGRQRVDEQYKMIRFVPGLPRNDFTDPSYHLPAFYELWSRWGPPADRDFWAQAAAASPNVFCSPPRIPQRASLPTTPISMALPTPRASRKSRNLRRGRLAHGQQLVRRLGPWWHKPRKMQQLSDRIQSFFAAQGMRTVRDVFNLDGSNSTQLTPTGLVATPTPWPHPSRHKSHLERFRSRPLTAPIPSGQEALLRRHALFTQLLHCSGRFRIYSPR